MVTHLEIQNPWEPSSRFCCYTTTCHLCLSPLERFVSFLLIKACSCIFGYPLVNQDSSLKVSMNATYSER
ncbi:hypothetical protein L2E82_39719 [Cichorium intybus]|uniref:Uncharacterized protein n=1 Tax=Cichorium intybus TaxID=13427 RepID=A0ACB9AIA2_CICIN|nr:hypothetical protein L2E82_39719 [Cichorium intybus]